MEFTDKVGTSKSLSVLDEVIIEVFNLFQIGLILIQIKKIDSLDMFFGLMYRDIF